MAAHLEPVRVSEKLLRELLELLPLLWRDIPRLLRELAPESLREKRSQG